MGLFFSKYYLDYTEAWDQQKISCEMSESLALSLFKTLILEENQEQNSVDDAESLSQALLEQIDKIQPTDLNKRYTHFVSGHEVEIFNEAPSCIKTNSAGDEFTEQTLLTLAARISPGSTFSAIMNHPHIDPNVMDNCHNTPLHIAIFLGKPEIVASLIKHPGTNILLKNIEGKTPLELAIDHEELEICRLLLDAYAEKDATLTKARSLRA